MANLTKTAAAKLVADIRSANIGAHALTDRSGCSDPSHIASYFLGGLQAVLSDFLHTHGAAAAAAEIDAAMTYVPTAAEIDARNALVASYRKPAAVGATA